MATVKTEMKTDFESLIRQHQAPVWQYLRYLGAAASEADDLAQETFLALLAAIKNKSFEERDPAATQGYLRRVARNQLLMSRRRRGKELDTVQLEVAETVWAQAMGEDHTRDGIETFLHALQQCREKLSGRAQQVVTLFYDDGLARDEIASRMDMKTQGIKTLLRRTRKSLRECVERGINR